MPGRFTSVMVTWPTEENSMRTVRFAARFAVPLATSMFLVASLGASRDAAARPHGPHGRPVVVGAPPPHVVAPPPPHVVVAPPVVRGPGVRVRMAPPPMRVEVRPMAPSPRHVWAPGYWQWRGGRHVWMAGSWIVPPVVGQ